MESEIIFFRKGGFYMKKNIAKAFLGILGTVGATLAGLVGYQQIMLKQKKGKWLIVPWVKADLCCSFTA